MGTYRITFDLITDKGNRTLRLESKDEIVIERNRSYAKLHLLNKYKSKDTDIIFKTTDCLIGEVYMGGDLQ